MRQTVLWPTSEEIQEEIDYLRSRSKARRRFWIVLCILLIIITGAAAGLLHCFPILKIRGDDMKPTLKSEQIVVAVRDSEIDREDMVAFRHKGETLIRRVIGLPGDEISIRKNGIVVVNGEEIEEAYVEEQSLGECDLEFPYEVPKGKVFVLGDNREDSLDSRSDSVGCIAKKKLVGEVKYRIWPLSESKSY